MKLALIAVAIAGFTFITLTFGPSLIVKGVFGLAATEAYAAANKESGGFLSIFVFLGMPAIVVAGLLAVCLVVGLAIFLWTRVSSAQPVSKAASARDRYGIRGSMDRGE